MRIRFAILAAAGAMGVASIAAAPAAEVALVESLTGTPAGLQVMDYLEPGKLITLGPRDTVVISYMRSCMRETITGGTVKVGTEESELQGAKVVRIKVPCDATRMMVAGDEAGQFGGRIFRSAPPAGPTSASVSPQFTLYGRAPVVELRAPGTLSLERIDRDGESYMVEVGSEQLVHGRFFDFAKTDRNLTAGGIYRISEGKRDIVFKVDPHAKPGNTPIVGRLLRFGSSS